MSRVGSRKGIPFVISAPSGTGKTTLCRAVLERDSGLRFSVSHTTRRPRSGEKDGVDYHFVSVPEFERLVAGGGFLEHAEYNGNQYGTSWRALAEPLEAGLDLLLEIEVQGARQVRERCSDARLIFLLPPSLEVLSERLRGRRTDSPETVEHRLAIAREELAAADFFDYAVVNDRLEEAVTAVLEIVDAERRDASAEVRRRYRPGGGLKR